MNATYIIRVTMADSLHPANAIPLVIEAVNNMTFQQPIVNRSEGGVEVRTIREGCVSTREEGLRNKLASAYEQVILVLEEARIPWAKFHRDGGIESMKACLKSLINSYIVPPPRIQGDPLQDVRDVVALLESNDKVQDNRLIAINERLDSIDDTLGRLKYFRDRLTEAAQEASDG